MRVLLSNVPSSIPKGSQRSKLKKDGRIADLTYFRSMTPKETLKHIQSSFEGLGNVSELQYLQAYRDNTLHMSVHQELDGYGVIKSCW